MAGQAKSPWVALGAPVHDLSRDRPHQRRQRRRTADQAVADHGDVAAALHRPCDGTRKGPMYPANGM
jgi:hypothetical protein